MEKKICICLVILWVVSASQCLYAEESLPRTKDMDQLQFKAPWGDVFLAGVKEGKSFLKVSPAGPEAVGYTPMLKDFAKLEAKHIVSNLAEGHKDVEIEDGLLSAAYSPKSRTLYFAFVSKGSLNWFGNIMKGDKVVFRLSMDKSGKNTRWYFNTFGAGAEINGLRKADETGWVEMIAVASTTYDRDKSEPKTFSGFQPRYVLHTDTAAFPLHIYPGAKLPAEGMWFGKKGKYRVQGCLGVNPNYIPGKKGDGDNPFLPSQTFMIIAVRVAKVE